MEDFKLEPKEKIQILLKEYDTLRAEILTRTSSGYQIMGIGAAVLTFLLSQAMSKKFWTLLAIFACVFFSLAIQSFGDIANCARRIRFLEQRINTLSGEELLGWETGSGKGAHGILFWPFRWKDRKAHRLKG